MTELYFDVFTVGGGAAGMAAALAASERGASVLLAEREHKLGGILNRCVHHGFGLGYFKEDLTGLEYADRFRDMIRRSDVRVMTDTEVLNISADKRALLSSPESLMQIHFNKCILASGSYERTLESIPVSGTRPAGIYSAGCLQEMINEKGYDTGDRIIILGSGNVGQIMARQLKASGKTIIAMLEKNDRPGGITRNVRECIEAFNIPLLLNTTIKEIHGSERIKGVTTLNTKTGQESFLACDTLITALGLIPDRSLLKSINEPSIPEWIRLCGNCDHIHDFVDTVTTQGKETVL